MPTYELQNSVNIVLNPFDLRSSKPTKVPTSQLFGVSRIFSNCPSFWVSKMASTGPNHLTAEEVCQSVCYSSHFRHQLCDFSRCFISTIVVFWEVGWLSSFCKHTTSTRQLPDSASLILAWSQYAQPGHNRMIW